MTAVFPGAVSTQAELRVLVNNVGTTLDGNHSDVVTTITVIDTTGFPSSGYATIDQEIFSYTGKTGTTFTGVTRAEDGTVNVAHSSGAPVDHYFVANHHNHMADEIIAIQQNLSDRLGLDSGSHFTVNPSQPCSLRSFNAGVSNVTGDGTIYSVEWPNAIIENGLWQGLWAFQCDETAGRYLI